MSTFLLHRLLNTKTDRLGVFLGLPIRGVLLLGKVLTRSPPWLLGWTVDAN